MQPSNTIAPYRNDRKKTQRHWFENEIRELCKYNMVFFHWFWKHNCFLPRIIQNQIYDRKKTLRSMQRIFHLNVYDSIRCLLWHTIEIEHHIFIGSVYHLEIFTATPFQIGIGCKPQKHNHIHSTMQSTNKRSYEFHSYIYFKVIKSTSR